MGDQVSDDDLGPMTAPQPVTNQFGNTTSYSLPHPAIDTSVQNPFAEYHRAPPLPGTTNQLSPQGLGQNIKRSWQLGIHDLASLEAATLGRLSEMTPSVVPTESTGPRGRGLIPPVPIPGWKGRGLDINLQSPLRKQDIGNAAAVPYTMMNELSSQHLAPLLHGDVQGWAENVYRDPGRSAQDALAFIPGAPKALHASLKAMPKVGKALAARLISKVPELHGAHAVDRMVDSILDHPDETGRTLREHATMRERELMRAYNQVPPEIRQYLTLIGEGTEPELEKWRQHPAVNHYFEVQDRLNEPLWLRGVAEGYFTKEDLLVSRVGPRYSAAVARGEIPAPVPPGVKPGSLAERRWHFLSAEQMYEPHVQQAMEKYMADEIDRYEREGLLKKGFHPFRGAYNTVASQKMVERYWEKRREGHIITSEKQATAAREQAHIQRTDIGDKRYMTIGGPGRSLDTARAAIMKMEQTGKFFAMLDGLASMDAVIEALPEAEQATAQRTLAGHVEQIAKDSGVDMTKINGAAQKAFDHLKMPDGTSAIENVHRFLRGQAPLGQGAVVRCLHALDAIREGLGTAGNIIGSKIGGPQRAFVVMTDAVMPFYLGLQQAMFFGMAVPKGPKSIASAMLAAKVASKVGLGKLENLLPYDWVEHRMQPTGNALTRMLAKYQGVGTHAINQIRVTHALHLLIEELNKVPSDVRRTFMQVLEGQVKAAKQLEDFLQGKGELGLSDKVYLEAEIAITKTLDAVYGKYTGAPSGVAQAMQNTGAALFGRVMNHALTLSYHLSLHNPKKIYLLRNVAHVAGQLQTQAASNYPDLRDDIKAHGGWVLNRLSPHGSYVVQGTGGWDLLDVALRMPVNAMNTGRFLQKKLFGLVEENVSEEQIELAPLNFLWASGLILAGATPNAQRPLGNPYHYAPEGPQGRQYDVSLLPPRGPPDTRKMIRDYPWSYDQPKAASEFLAETSTAMAAGFDNKLWSYVKFITGQVTGIRTSDKTTPFPGMHYPKVDLRQGRMEPSQPAYPFQFLPGGNKLSPYTVRAVSPQEAAFKQRDTAPEVIRYNRHGKALRTAPEPEVIRRAMLLKRLQQQNPGKF